jgi:CBS domain containing-hemolysin-like protein
MVLSSAYFSVTEIAFSALNRVRIKNMAERGSKRAALVLRLFENYDKVISTVLIGNTIVNIAAASGATVLFVQLYGDIGASVSTVVLTVVLLVFAEISPKSIAKGSPEKYAMFSAPFLNVLIIIFTPVNYLFNLWQRFLAKVFKSANTNMTEEELMTIINEAENHGAIDEEDKQLMQNVINFNDSVVKNILTPRVDIIGVSNAHSVEKIAETFIKTGYSRIPVFEKTIDNIIGVIHIRDFFEVAQSKNSIEGIVTSAVFVTPYVKIGDLLKRLQTKKCHLAVVTDEYGGTVGIVTLEDILEELVGEIWDEHDEIIEKFSSIDNDKYKISCSVDTHEFFDFFELKDKAAAPTVSGWIIQKLGAIPNEGDTFTYENLSITVSKTENRRAIEIIATKN